MLAFLRSVGQTFKIGDDITIQIVDSSRRSVRIAVDAPSYIEINRSELYEQKLRDAGRDKLPVRLITLVKCFNSEFMPDDVAASVFGQSSYRDQDTLEVYVDSDLQESMPDLYNWFCSNGAVAGDRVIVERGSWTT